MPIRCPRCGHGNPDDARACARCAAPLAPALAETLPAPAETLPAAPGTPAETLPAAAAAASVTPAASPAAAAEETVLGETRPAPSASGATGTAAAGGADLLQPGTDLGPRYHIGRLLGRGGMGAVYLARDRELGRDVAIKVIAPQLLADPGFLDRFKREIQLSSIVTHPNVLRVYDLGEADGTKFLTMQFVEGRSLEGVLRDDRPVAIERAVALFRQTCEGLSAAHEQGVLHRDLKPQNVMVDAADRVYLTDFGLATSQFLTAMTQTGAVMGTPHYMSPEQVKGEPVDARSDIFSLGVMLYQMLAGVLPYQGDSVYEVMVRRVQAPAPAIGDANPAIPAHLRGVVEKCLAIDKQQRYASVREIVADLDSGSVSRPVQPAAPKKPGWPRWVAVAAALILVAAVAGTWQYLRRAAPPGATAGPADAAAPVPLVGVVPFANRTGDASLDWAGDGVARLVADSLALSRHVRVVSSQRVAELRAGAKDEPAFFAAASGGGIAYLVTGEILAGPSGFTVATRVTDTKAGTDVASNRADGASKSDVMGAANQVAMAVRRGLRIPLTEGVDTYNADFATKNTDAYEIYVKGLSALSAYKFDEARRLFTESLAKAPDFTMAKFRLANVHASVGEADQAAEQIRAAVAEASRLPDREARYVRALDAYLGRNYDEASKQYGELIDRYPYDIEPRQYLADIHLKRSEWQQAIEQARAMAQIEPQSHSTYAIAGSAYLGLKDYNQAIAEFRKYSELEPDSANARHLLADAYRAQGVLDLAAAEYRRALDADPAFHFSTVSLAQVEAMRGQRGEAERLLAPLVPDTGVSPGFRVDAAVDLAAVLRAQGRFRDAIEALGRAEAPLRAEKIREALAMATRALSHLELGELKRAEQLARDAVAKSPGVPTRYLFALAQVQLAQGRLADARATAAEILKGAAPPSDTDRTEDKAAAYITGLAWLKEGKPQRAQEELSRAVALSGYEYAIYRLGLARAYLAMGSFAEALGNVKQATAPGDPTTPRLDLDLDRVRAGLLEAQVDLAMSRRPEAAAAAKAFLQAWTRADPGLPDVAEARKLAILK